MEAQQVVNGERNEKALKNEGSCDVTIKSEYLVSDPPYNIDLSSFSVRYKNITAFFGSLKKRCLTQALPAEYFYF